MKPASLSEGRRGPAQIWNSAPQLAQIPAIHPHSLVPPGARVVIIAPHPGDEVLACGGLLQRLSTLEHPILLISITDGSASHPGSNVWPASRLSVVRPQESVEALRRLGMPLHSLKWIRGGFRDDALAASEHPVSRSCSCSTSRSATWMPSCAWKCAPKSSACTRPAASPACTSPTTRSRP